MRCLVADIDPKKTKIEVFEILAGKIKQGQQLELWNSRAAQRIVAILARELA